MIVAVRDNDFRFRISGQDMAFARPPCAFKAVIEAVVVSA